MKGKVRAERRRSGGRRLSRFLALAIVVLAACTTRVAQSDLWSHPESQLLYPGSETLDKREREAQTAMAGGSAASVGYLLGSDDTAAMVEDFYARELSKLGWLPPVDNEARTRGIRTTAELMARAWRKGDLVFRLGILDQSHPAAEGPSDEFKTVFRIDLIAEPAET